MLLKKTLIVFVSLILFVSAAYKTEAKKEETGKIIKIDNCLRAGDFSPVYPIFSEFKNTKNNKFELKDLLKANYIDINKITPTVGDDLKFEDKTYKWTAVEADDNRFKEESDEAFDKIVYYAVYFNTDRFAKATIKISSHHLFEAYIDGEMIASKYSADKKKKDKGKVSKSIEPELGKHRLIIKVLYSGKCDLKRFISAEIKLDEEFENADLSISISPERSMKVQDIYSGTKISSARISPEGSMTMLRFKRWLPEDKSETWTEIRNIASGKTIKSFRRSNVHSLTWGNDDKTIMYKASSNKKQSLFLFNLETNIETPVLENIDKLGACYLSPDNSFVVYSIKLKADDETGAMLRTYGMQDRWPGFRDRNFLYKVDIASGQKRQLTFGRQSTDIHDISHDSKRILFSKSTPDYIERPFDKQDMFILTIDNMKLETLWENKRFSVSASFSPDGKELLLTGGPSAFGKIGENIGSQKIANNYDMQLYIYDLATKKVNPITKNFNPSVKGSVWSPVDKNIYILGQDETYYRLFKYDVLSKTMTNIESGADVCGSFSVAAKKLAACYTGVSMTSPRKAFSIDLTNNQFKIIADPGKETYKNVKFGQTENWDFKNKDGVRIEGRVYYPPNYDKSKKYPLIVYYYGGTSPVSRSFGGRYPFNIYTANGYIVYVLQPSGATGFGQEFSAAHVNNWGLTVADEIIKGTKEFLAAHKSADPTKVGCIGASYGGFMTMLLQTRTDIYAAAISHAGISSISSYWGEGWWGYAYSAEASADSYPWNNRKLYVDQSPLFNADKVKTPIMLLHGTVDTNVPIGESLQFYAALKILGKEVELIRINGSDHLVVKHSQRIEWHNTIIAWFGKWLKESPARWDNLYPEKNY